MTTGLNLNERSHTFTRKYVHFESDNEHSHTFTTNMFILQTMILISFSSNYHGWREQALSSYNKHNMILHCDNAILSNVIMGNTTGWATGRFGDYI